LPVLLLGDEGREVDGDLAVDEQALEVDSLQRHVGKLFGDRLPQRRLGGVLVFLVSRQVVDGDVRVLLLELGLQRDEDLVEDEAQRILHVDRCLGLRQCLSGGEHDQRCGAGGPCLDVTSHVFLPPFITP